MRTVCEVLNHSIDEKKMADPRLWRVAMRVLTEQARAKGRLLHVAVERPDRRVVTVEQLLYLGHILRGAACDKRVILFAAHAPKDVANILWV